MTQEEKAKAYDKALEIAKAWRKLDNNDLSNHDLETLFPEIRESGDERIRKALLDYFGECKKLDINPVHDAQTNTILAWLEKQGEPQDKGEISDGYHTFNELYYYRMLYNAAFFNMLPKEWVHKSKRHNDGEECFGGGWFIVMANLPTGQISNHYELKDWDLFQIPEKEVADKWDGHTPQEAADRLHKYLLEKRGEQKPAEWSKEDEEMCQETIDWFEKKCFPYALESENPARESIKWLKSLKDRVGCEANCITTKEWSVEDMSKIQRICEYLDEAKKYYADITEVRECIDWLKSLKDRYTRTDAFIEQVEKYLQEHLIDYWSQSVTDENKFIEDFKNYIKGK